MIYRYQELEQEIGALINESIVIEPDDKQIKVFIGFGEVIKFKNILYQQKEDTKTYILNKLRKKAPEYFL